MISNDISNDIEQSGLVYVTTIKWKGNVIGIIIYIISN